VENRPVSYQFLILLHGLLYICLILQLSLCLILHYRCVFSYNWWCVANTHKHTYMTFLDEFEFFSCLLLSLPPLVWNTTLQIIGAGFIQARCPSCQCRGTQNPDHSQKQLLISHIVSWCTSWLPSNGMSCYIYASFLVLISSDVFPRWRCTDAFATVLLRLLIKMNTAEFIF